MPSPAMFPSSGEGREIPTLLDPVTEVSSLCGTHVWGRKQIQFPERCVLNLRVFIIPDDGQNP
jgi:hypothetical protein